MAFIVKALGAGAVGAGVSDIYTVPDPRSALVTSVRLVNVSATGSAAVHLLVRPSGTAKGRQLTRLNGDLPLNAMLLMEDVVTLGQGDTIQVAVSGTTPSVSYVVSGMERD